MPHVPCVKVLRNALLVAFVGLMPGCSPKTPLDRAGITLSPEKSWHRAKQNDLDGSGHASGSLVGA